MWRNKHPSPVKTIPAGSPAQRRSGTLVLPVKGSPVPRLHRLCRVRRLRRLRGSDGSRGAHSDSTSFSTRRASRYGTSFLPVGRYRLVPPFSPSILILEDSSSWTGCLLPTKLSRLSSRLVRP